MDPSLPSPSTPPAVPHDPATDLQKTTIAENLRNADGSPAGPAVGVATPAATPGTQLAQTKPGLWGAVMEVFNKFSDDDVMTQAAALAFYTGISLAPLLTVIVWVMQLATPVDAKKKIEDYAVSIIGPQSRQVVKSVISPEAVPDGSIDGQPPTPPQAATPQAATPQGTTQAATQAGAPTTSPGGADGKTEAQANMTITGIASIVFLAFTASGVLAQLQSSLNLLWSVKPDPKKSGILILIRKRVFSFGMLFTVLFLLLVSMLVTFAINVVVEAIFGKDVTAIAQLTNVAITLGIATGVFMLLFTYLPDVRVPWKDTLFGAALTAVLFVVGRWAIGQVLSRSDYSTSYGAAIGSFLALLVWVYYTSIIMFLGTEATTVYTRRRGHDPKPERHAVRTLRTERVLEQPHATAKLATA